MAGVPFNILVSDYVENLSALLNRKSFGTKKFIMKNIE